MVDTATKVCTMCGEEKSRDAFRGVLCRQCNRALGMFRDSPTILHSALEYLELNGSYGDEADD